MSLSIQQVLSTSGYENYTDIKRLKFIIEFLQQHIPPGGSVLDVGCGNGIISHSVGKRGFDVFGIDISEKAIEKAMSKNNLPNVKFAVMSAEEFSTGKTYDAVICSEVLEHVFELDATLKEINRVMKSGSNILITCPFVWNEHEVPFDYARYSRFALKDILNRNGFEITHFAKSGNFMTTITQLRILYFFTAFGKRWSGFFLSRWAFKFLFVLIPNLTGLLLSKLFPLNDSLYLNNVLVAKKISSSK